MPSKSAKPRRPGPREQAPTRRIAIIAFPGVTLLDISGPAQVFAELQEIELQGPGYSLSYLSTSGGLVPTDVGMMVDTAPIDSVRPHQVDTLVIPGGPGSSIACNSANTCAGPDISSNVTPGNATIAMQRVDA